MGGGGGRGNSNDLGRGALTRKESRSILCPSKGWKNHCKGDSLLGEKTGLGGNQAEPGEIFCAQREGGVEGAISSPTAGVCFYMFSQQQVL